MRLAKTGALWRPGRPSGSSYALLASVLVGAGLAGCATPARQVDVKLPSAYEAPAGAPLGATNVLATIGMEYLLDSANPELGVAATMAALPVLIPLGILLIRRLQASEVQL